MSGSFSFVVAPVFNEPRVIINDLCSIVVLLSPGIVTELFAFLVIF